MPRRLRLSVSSLSLGLIVTTLTSLLHAKMATGRGSMVILMSRNDVNDSSNWDGVISGQARVFLGSNIASINSCLCGNVTDGGSGWCYLGETLNAGREVFNVSTSESMDGALLKCTLYITVGKSYLYCNSKLANRETDCEALIPCPSKIIAAVCSDQRDCVAWCDRNRTLPVVDEEEREAGGVQPAVKVVHHLGHDVIAVIITGGVLCILVLACCIFDKIKSSKWYILRFPKKHKKSESMKEDFKPAVSTLPSPLYDQQMNFALNLIPPPAKSRDDKKRASIKKKSKRKLKDQFRSMSLPTMLECNDADLILDQPAQRSGSCESSPSSSHEDIKPDIKMEEDGAGYPNLESSPTPVDSTKL